MELWQYKCECCTGTFYVPTTNTARDPELCPFCGSSSECDRVGQDTIKVEVTPPKDRTKKRKK